MILTVGTHHLRERVLLDSSTTCKKGSTGISAHPEVLRRYLFRSGTTDATTVWTGLKLVDQVTRIIAPGTFPSNAPITYKFHGRTR